MLNAEVDDVIWTILQNGVLRCEMYGYLRGEIEWLKDGQQVQSVGRYSITVSAGSREGQDGGESSVSSVVSQLTIQQVEQGDEGTYTCTAVGTSLQERIYVNISSEHCCGMPKLCDVLVAAHSNAVHSFRTINLVGICKLVT